MGFFQKIKAVWEKISLVQRALLIAIVLTFIIAGALLTHWARRPDMRMLYQELAPEEAAQITEKIGEQGIAYVLRNGGTSIYVPKEKVYQLRLDMAKEGLPAGGQGGYKIFENEKFKIVKFGKIRDDGTIEVPNNLTLKWVLPYYKRVTEKQITIVMWMVTGIFCLLGIFIPF